MSRLHVAFRETVSGLPRAYWWLWTGTLVNRMGAFVLPFLAFYLTAELGYRVQYAGLVLSLFGLGSAGGAVLGGVMADRLGRRPTLLAAQVSTAVVLVALGMSHGRLLVAVWATLLGLANNAARPAYSAMMTDIVAPKDRVRAFSLHYWAINLGFAIAPVLAGVLAASGYLTLFLIDAATTLAMALLVFAKVPESHPGIEIAGSRPTRQPGSILDALRDPVFMGFTGVTFLLATIFMQHTVTLPIAMEGDGLSPAQYGSVMAVNGLLIVLVTVPATRWLQRFPRSRVLALAALLVGAGFGLTAYASAPVAYALTVVVWTCGEVLNAPVSTAVVADLAPREMRGRYQGVYTLSWSAASFVAPLAGGWVFGTWGGGTLWAACAVLGVLCAAGHLAIAPARSRRLAALAAAEGSSGGEPAPEGGRIATAVLPAEPATVPEPVPAGPPPRHDHARVADDPPPRHDHARVADDPPPRHDHARVADVPPVQGRRR